MARPRRARGRRGGRATRGSWVPLGEPCVAQERPVAAETASLGVTWTAFRCRRARRPTLRSRGVRRLQLLAMALAVGACSPVVSEARRPGRAPAKPAASVDATTAVARAEKLGRELFRYDAAAALASDLLLTRLGAADPRVSGWVVVEEEGRPVAYFFGAQGDALLYRVVPGKDAASTEVAEGGVLPGAVLPLVVAHRAALSTPFRHAKTPYDVVVLSMALVGEPGYFVYFLAEPTRPGEVMAGGHVRMSVSPEGKVTEVFSFTKNLEPIPPPPPGTESTGIVVTHVTSDTPAETHVYLSLLTRQPVYVTTRIGDWIVDGGYIRRAGSARGIDPAPSGTRRG